MMMWNDSGFFHAKFDTMMQFCIMLLDENLLSGYIPAEPECQIKISCFSSLTLNILVLLM